MVYELFGVLGLVREGGSCSLCCLRLSLVELFSRVRPGKRICDKTSSPRLRCSSWSDETTSGGSANVVRCKSEACFRPQRRSDEEDARN